MKQQDPAPKTESKDPRFTAPTVSLPKGGGAIRGIGEKFAANPVTGTGSFSIPLPLSPGRAGFTPALSLSYDSGSGNGPYGFGWNVSYPQITRRTDRGLPQYHDDEESDVYILSGAEDLVPVPREDGLPFEERDGFRVTRYRPRIEGLFARIERWRSVSEPSNVFWRSISRDNVTTVYGKSPESRIVDPLDPARIFSWLLCESFDDKGNAAVYEYILEDDRSVKLENASEANRSTLSRSANRYLKKARYGNSVSRLAPEHTPSTWLFELVMDYGDHEGDVPSIAPTAAWAARPDPFSTYRAGFEVRTYRRCQRVLMFHSFSELGPKPKLVRSLVLDYQDLTSESDVVSELAHQGSTPIGSFLRRATLVGYAESGLSRSLPPVEFTYSRPEIKPEVQTLDPASLENLPIGVDGARYQWIDLDGEGLSGILTEQAGAWWYKRNLGKQLGPLELVARKPSVPLEAGTQLLDLAGDGQLDLVQFAHPNAGYFEREDEKGWSEFTTFKSQPNIDWADPNLRHVDLSGDGHADVLITEHDVFTWHPSLGEDGFGPSQRVRLPPSEEEGPRLVFADGEQAVYLADLSGDGLTDLVRIRNGEVCYWPNLGYGRFGAKVTMDHSPWFDAPDQFNQHRVRLADIDGSGATDIIYLGRDGVRLYFNQSGNAWSEALVLRNVPSVDNLSSVVVTDLLGNGTACLVWSSSLPGDARQPLRYLDLMGGNKPHLLIHTANNLGAETLLQYAASTKFYLADQRAGKPWISRLPFPVHVVEQVTTNDRISRNRFVTRYAYHHGYFDGVEREFRGFGMVEQFDTEEFAALETEQELAATNVDSDSHVPPVLTRTWFHTGMHLGGEHVSDFFAGLLNATDTGEYYREPGLSNPQARQRLLDDTVLPSDLSAAEEREARRALKGAMLRQEVYALDAAENASIEEKVRATTPYTVTEQNFTLRRLQPLGTNRHAVFLSHPRESIAYHYERNPTDPRVAHSLTLEVDDFGNVLQSAAVAYGRRSPDPLLEEDDGKKQTERHVTCVESRVTNAIEEEDAYRAPLPFEARTYELTGLSLEEGCCVAGPVSRLVAAEMAQSACA